MPHSDRIDATSSCSASFNGHMMPYFRPRVEKVKQIPESREARNRMFHDDMDEWRLRMMQADKA